MEYEITDLALEITRKCNMRCAHCLRGEAQKQTMGDDIIKSALQAVKVIRTLTFTGGEPTLAVNQILYALKCAQENEIEINQIYLVTNGKVVSDRFLNAMRDWHIYCQASSQGYRGPDISGDRLSRMVHSLCDYSREERYGAWVALSADKYHEPISIQNVYRLSSIPFFNADKAILRQDKDWIIQEGRAKENCLYGTPGRELRRWEYDERATQLDPEVSNDGQSCKIEQLYIAYDGAVVKNCDYTYEQIPSFQLEAIEPGKYPHGVDTHWLDRLAAKHLEKSE